MIEQDPEKDYPHPPLPERYELIKLLGKGGMGSVFQVLDLELNKFFAIKVLNPELVTDPSAVKRFEQEAQALSALSHDRIVSVYQFGLAGESCPYIVMDFVEGKTLAEYIKSSAKISTKQATDIVLQICEALSYAHKNDIVHRDLKPANVLICDSTENFLQIRLVDFGIAKLATQQGQTSLTQTGEIFGSPEYMSPEQCQGEPLDKRSDIYSLGCVFYELLTGQSAFSGPNMVKVILKQTQEPPPPIKDSSIAPGIKEIVGCCLSKTPDMRYENVDDLASDLKAVAIGQKPAFAKKLRGLQTFDIRTVGSDSASKTAVWFIASFSILAIFGFGLSRFLGTMGVSDANRTTFDKYKNLNGNGVNANNVADSAAISYQNRSYSYEQWKEFLGGRKNTQTLSLVNSNFDDSCVPLILNMPLIFLDVSGCHNLSREGFEELKLLKTLRSLMVEGTYFGDNDISLLTQNLSTINLGHTEISDLGIKELVSLQNLRNLKILGLSETAVTDAGFAELKKLPKLSHVVVSSDQLTNKVIDRLAELKLERLEVEKPIHKVTLNRLSKLKGLDTIVLHFWKRQDSVEKELSLLLPETTVIWGR